MPKVQIVSLEDTPIADAATGIAHVNLQFGDDRVVRQAYLEEGDGKRAWVERLIQAGADPGRRTKDGKGLADILPVG